MVEFEWVECFCNQSTASDVLLNTALGKRVRLAMLIAVTILRTNVIRKPSASKAMAAAATLSLYLPSSNASSFLTSGGVLISQPAYRWNARHSEQLDADELLALPPTPGIRAYVALHEDVIASETPFCQLAIEYEIEGLSLSLGPKVMQKCERMLGKESAHGLSFLEEHIAIDAGHTLFNAAELERLIAPAPERAVPLGRTGSRALDTYGMFLTECSSLAKAHYLRLVASNSVQFPPPHAEARPH
jgi:hypothetical protein